MYSVDISKRRQLSRVVIGSVCAGAALVFAAIPGYAATTTVHSASSYGAEVNAGSLVKLGQVAVAQLPSCYTQAIGSNSASVASVASAGLIATGLVDSTASSDAGMSTATSDVLGVNLLNGLISSTEIKAVSTSSVSGSGAYSFSAAGSTIGSLTVLGVRIGLNVAPNTVIALPFVGSVTLNEQISYAGPDRASLTVHMIHVKITLGSNKGTEIIVGDAYSSIESKSVPAVVGGYAYAPKLVAKPIGSGPLVQENIPCFGTGGELLTDAVASVAIPGVVTTGAVTVTATGSVVHSEASGETTSSIAGANLLSGLVSATAIDGTASGSTTDGVNFEFSGGSTFAGLSVAGHPEITVDVAPNTKISIAGLGTLYLNKVTKAAGRIDVVPVELDVNAANTLGLPIGAKLTLGATGVKLYGPGN